MFFWFNQFPWRQAILFIHYAFSGFKIGLILCDVVFLRTFIWFFLPGGWADYFLRNKASLK